MAEKELLILASHRCLEMPGLGAGVLELQGFIMNLCDLIQLCPSSKQKNCTTQC